MAGIVDISFNKGVDGATIAGSVFVACPLVQDFPSPLNPDLHSHPYVPS
jgi:hypothetical protein